MRKKRPDPAQIDHVRVAHVPDDGACASSEENAAPTRRQALAALVGLAGLTMAAETAGAKPLVDTTGDAAATMGNMAGIADACPPPCEQAIPATELGIVPGTSADQSHAFAEALTRAGATGRSLRLPPGELVIGEVEVNAPIGIISGPDSRLVCRAGARRMMTLRGPRAHLFGLHVNGAAQRNSVGGPNDEESEGLITLRDVEDVRVSGCVVEGSGGMGLALSGCRGRVEANAFSDIADGAIFALDCQDMEILRNDIDRCGNNGIMVWQSEKRRDGALVAMNRIRHVRIDSGGDGQFGNAVNIFRAAHVRVLDNDIADCAYTAVRVDGGDGCVIARNICRRLGEVAIFVEFAHRKAIVADNLVEHAVSGITITNWEGGDTGRMATVSGNIIRDMVPRRGQPGEEGFGIQAEAEVAITGNVIERARKYGLLLGWGRSARNLVATGNVVRDCPVGAAVSFVKGAKNIVVAANSFDRVRYAVAGYDHDDRITGDLLGSDRGKRPRFLMLHANAVSRR